MPVAPRAPSFDAPHPVSRVDNRLDVRRIERMKEAWPTGARFEFGVGCEEGQATKAARVDAWFLILKETAAEGVLRAMIEQDVAFLGCQPLCEPLAFIRREGVEVVSGSGDCGHRRYLHYRQRLAVTDRL
jgi:hypothetical protein